MKITRKQLTEMVQEAVREALIEQAPAWGVQGDQGGLGAFASKRTGTSGIYSAQAAGRAAKAAKAAPGLEKTATATPTAKRSNQDIQQDVQQANAQEQLFAQVKTAVMKLEHNPEKLKALYQYLRSI